MTFEDFLDYLLSPHNDIFDPTLAREEERTRRQKSSTALFLNDKAKEVLLLSNLY